MATTLTVSLFRNDEVTIGHVGDCRAYLVQEGRVRQVTADHSYAAMQLQAGPDLRPGRGHQRDALHAHPQRRPGARSCRSITTRVQVNHGDCLVQCSDGLHHCVTEEEIAEIVTHAPPAEACRRLVALAEKRGTDDNLSVQVVADRARRSR